MLDREDGVKNCQAKRDRDTIDRLGGVIRRIQSSGHVLANESVQLVLGTAPSHASIPPNQNGTMAKDGLIRVENVLGKIQPSERH